MAHFALLTTMRSPARDIYDWNYCKKRRHTVFEENTWDNFPVHVQRVSVLQNRAAWAGFQPGNLKYFCECFPGEMSCGGSAGPGQSPVCCNPGHLLRAQPCQQPRAGCMCGCSVPVSDMGFASFLQSDADTTELCVDQRQRRWLPPCSSIPTLIPAAWCSPGHWLPELLQKARAGGQLSAGIMEHPWPLPCQQQG